MINLSNVLKNINPLHFSDYLVETGWKEIKRKNPLIRLFQFDDGTFYQIIIPIDSSLSDYQEAMYEAIKTLSEKEKRPIDKIIFSLVNPNADVIRIRFSSRSVELGNIPFDNAIKLYENAKKIIIASALDLVEPQKYHRGKMNEKINQFVSNCKFGQTEFGSYVISIICPFQEESVKEDDRQITMFSPTDKYSNSFARRVTTNIFNNISIIKEMIDSGDSKKLYEEYNNYNISANFLDALNGMGIGPEDDFVEFMDDWDNSTKQTSNIQSDIVLSSKYYAPITNIINELKKSTYSDTIIGRVTRLDAAPATEDRSFGCVTIAYIGTDAKTHKISSTLDLESYDKAILAHKSGQYVKAIGEVSTNGNKTILNCISFELL